MVSFLVLYGTGEGRTATVDDRIGAVLGARGHDVTTTNADEIPTEFDLEEFDAVLVGASIHVGGHQPVVREFVRTHREALITRATAFFQLSLPSAPDDETRQAEAAGYVEAFLEGTGWHPDRLARLGGALRCSRYGSLKRLMTKRIAAAATGDTDASREYEYTDRHEVESFAADFAAFVEGRLGVAPEANDDDGIE